METGARGRGTLSESLTNRGNNRGAKLIGRINYYSWRGTLATKLEMPAREEKERLLREGAASLPTSARDSSVFMDMLVRKNS